MTSHFDTPEHTYLDELQTAKRKPSPYLHDLAVYIKMSNLMSDRQDIIMAMKPYFEMRGAYYLRQLASNYNYVVDQTEELLKEAVK